LLRWEASEQWSPHRARLLQFLPPDFQRTPCHQPQLKEEAKPSDARVRVRRSKCCVCWTRVIFSWETSGANLREPGSNFWDNR
jgi:hypothetical protein